MVPPDRGLLGWGQAAVLRRVLPRFPAVRWIVVTSAAAVLAYAVGLAPSTLARTWAGWPPDVLIPIAALLGLILLNSIGTAQWTVLRGLVPRAGRWIVVTAIAWLGGLTVFLAVSMPLWHPGQALAVTVGIGLFAGLLMAATMAAITGLTVRRLVPCREGPRKGRRRTAGPEVLAGAVQRSCPATASRDYGRCASRRTSKEGSS